MTFVHPFKGVDLPPDQKGEVEKPSNPTFQNRMEEADGSEGACSFAEPRTDPAHPNTMGITWLFGPKQMFKKEIASSSLSHLVVTADCQFQARLR